MLFFHENIEVGGSSVKLGSLVQASLKLESENNHFGKSS
jgi:hypothetical protein